MKLNDSTSLLVPTFNRPTELKRLLGYLNIYGEGSRIVIADSSTAENKKENEKIISNMNNLNIKYVNDYPQDTHPSIKFHDMCKYSTEYSVFCGDDDLMSIRGINMCTDFLKENKNYSAAHGYFIKYQVQPKLTWWHEIYLTKISESDNPLERMLFNFGSYIATFYDVHRTKHIEMTMGEVPIYSKGDSFDEVLRSLLDSIYGKIKMLPVTYCMREKAITYKDIGQGDAISISKSIDNGTYKDIYPKWKSCLIKHLKDKINENEDIIGKKIDRGMKSYLRGNSEKIARHNFTEEDVNDVEIALKFASNHENIQEMIWSRDRNAFMETKKL